VLPQNENELELAERAWMSSLADLDKKLIEVTMVSWDEHWPPSPKELRNAALELRAIANGESGAPSLDEAWAEFKENYRTRGPWSHQAVEAAANALGCKEYGNSEVADEMAWRAHFFKLYGSATGRIAKESEPAPPALAAYMEGVLKRAPQPELAEGS
jgi:hypothetical protein